MKKTKYMLEVVFSHKISGKVLAPMIHKEFNHGARGIAQWTKVSAAQPGGMSSIPVTHTMQREN